MTTPDKDAAPRSEAETALVLNKPPAGKLLFQGVLVVLRKRPADLALSPDDWSSLGLEEGDEGHQGLSLSDVERANLQGGIAQD
jgi:hypothetical protein